MVWEKGFGRKMHGYDNKRVERDEIVNRVPPTLLVFVTNNNKLIQFMISFFLYGKDQTKSQLLKKTQTNKLLHKFEFACTFWWQTRWMPWVKWVSPTIQKTWANSCLDCFLLFSNEAPTSNSVQNNISHCVWIEKVKKTFRTCEPLVFLIRGNSLRNCSILKRARF